jgi:hypothetical protein
MKNETGNGIGIAGTIFLIFLTLKLTKVGTVADWSWLWVTSPIWIPFCLIFVIAFIVAFTTAFIKTFRK